jgi:hypothetical protein
VTIGDTGSGIAPEDLEKVFDPFFTTKGVGEGSGLGLSMVYGFARQSQGYVTIDSEVGWGTTVKLYLPRSREAGKSKETAGEMPEAAPRPARILVVEDDDQLREIPVGLFRNRGFEVAEARNGAEALEHLGSGEAFDLLFSDVVLPGGHERGRDRRGGAAPPARHQGAVDDRLCRERRDRKARENRHRRSGQALSSPGVVGEDQ